MIREPSDAGQVPDDFELLDMMMADTAAASELWRPSPYWQSYCNRIVAELRRTGLRDFRKNQIILKGFLPGGVPQPSMPQSSWKRALWRLVEGAPVARRIVSEYRRLVAAEHRRYVFAQTLHASMALDRIAETFPDLAPPEGLANGGAEDAFEWRGHLVTAQWVLQLARIADFYRVVPRETVQAILEIGPGLGLSTLSHLALNPNLRCIVNVDIVPVLYVSTQYLRTIGGVEVVDYRATRGQSRIQAQSRDGVRIYQIAPWQLPAIDGQFDYFFNAYSFHEMSRAICEGYAQAIKPLVSGGALLHSSPQGNTDLPPNYRHEPVTLEFLTGLFADSFPHCTNLDGFWPQIFGRDARRATLLTRETPAQADVHPISEPAPVAAQADLTLRGSPKSPA